MPRLSIAAALCAVCLTLPAHAQDGGEGEPMILQDGAQVHPNDAVKLQMLDMDMGIALRQAFAAGAPEDVAKLTRALGGVAVPPDQALPALKGDWKCQTFKIGDLTPLTVYDNFKCRVDGTNFEKVSGSQRTSGAFHVDGERLLYLGTGYVDGNKAPSYADLPNSPEAGEDSGQVWSDVAVVEVVSPNRARLIFADPALESLINVIYLTR